MYMNSEQKKLNFYARMAGVSYLVFIICGFVMNFVCNRKFNKLDDATMSTIFQNEMHFRIGALLETILFAAVICASVFFYRVCRSVNSPLSQIALCFRLVEAIIGGVAVLVSFGIIALVNSTVIQEALNLEQLHSLVLIVAHFNLPAYEYSWISMGFAGCITFCLFYKARFIPRALSVWGVITYLSLILYPVANLLIADLPPEAMYVMGPGALFELTVSLWLIVKGINFTAQNNEAQSQSLTNNAEVVTAS